MSNRSSPHPPNWRLWHPTNGVVFHQQPLYPVLDVARFYTEASSARGTEPAAPEPQEAAVQTTESTVGFRSTLDGLQRNMVLQESISRRSRTSYTTSAEDCEGVVQETQLTERSRQALASTAQEDYAAQAEAEAEPETTESPKNHEVPFTPLDYKMSSEIFQAAKIAEEGSPESYWSYSFYRGPDEQNDVKGKVRVHYCKSAQTAERALQYLEGEKLLGLDLEWDPHANKNSSVRKQISLVQIASQSRVVLLHLALYPTTEFVTPTLKKLLEDPEITKLGVWINGDCTRLKKFLDVEVRGKFELSHLFKQVKYSASRQPELINKKLVALATQIKDVMGLPMKKDLNVRASDWSQSLDLEQIGYSASDAYAAVQLFAMLNHQREQLDPSPALPFHTEMGKPIPIPPGLDPPSEDEALAEDEVADEPEIEAEAELGANDIAVADRSEDTQLVDESQGRVVKGAKRGAASVKSPQPPKDPRIEAAEQWLKEYKERCGGKIKAQPAALRAYHIWHTNEELECMSIARILRDPPLKTSSVAGYIVSSVQMEKLPYDKVRMKTDVMMRMPTELARKRYFPLWAAVNYSKDL
ncbi:hypothetical protein N0V82_001841 [Gnomoniopsis sp. IMI 355080]|nr:hypothetical protein N0V82_001841 [Gnomoniopsis sp. IMI 355080]